MIRRKRIFDSLPAALLVGILCSGLLLQTQWVHSQDQAEKVPPGVASRADPDVPPSALLTDRGQALAQRLKQLRRSMETMGPRHPTLQDVKQELADVKEQLQAWASGADSSIGDAPITKAELNDQDVRQLLLRIVGKLNQLDRRVTRLEAASGS
ncbi:MAG: hypothetical protein AAF958_01065 [Planctomycetota bacterium]